MAAGALYGKQRRAQPSTDDSHRLANQHEKRHKMPRFARKQRSECATRQFGHKNERFRSEKTTNENVDESP